MIRLLSYFRRNFLMIGSAIAFIALAGMVVSLLVRPVEISGFLEQPVQAEWTANYQDIENSTVFPEIGLQVIEEALLDQGIEPSNAGGIATQIVMQLITPIFSATPNLIDNRTPTLLPTPTLISTEGLTPTYDRDLTATATASATLTFTPTPTRTRTFLVYPTSTPTRTKTPAPTSTQTLTLTLSPTPSFTQTVTATITTSATASATASLTATQTATLTKTLISTLTSTPSVTPTSTITQAFNPSATPSPSGTLVLTATHSATPSPSGTVNPTTTPSATPSPSGTLVPTVTQSATPSPTTSVQPTLTLSPTATFTGVPLPSFTLTPTPQISATFTATPNATGSQTPSFTPSPTLTRTSSPTLTSTFTVTLSPTVTPTTSPLICSDPYLVTGLLPSDDTYINLIQPNRNFGTDELFQVWANNNSNRRGLLRFDLSSIPANAIINNATLYIYTRDSRSGVMTTIYRVTSGWSETTATWSSPWNSAGGDYDNQIAIATYYPNTADCMITLNITQLVARWVNGTYENYGLLLYSSGSNYAFRYTSKEETTDLQLRPRLNISYTTPDGNSGTSIIQWPGDDDKP